MSERSAGDEAMQLLGRSPGFAQRFEPASKLGEGGMGAVYLVKDRILDRPVAIKVILGGQTIDRRRFEREARMLAQVTHPGVLRVFDFGVIEDIPYMAMELLDGESLREPLKRHGHLPPAEAVSIMIQILSGLEAVHTKGIVHRDLKPENVQMLSDGSIRLVDFGLARTSASPDGGRSGSTLTQPGLVMGTPAYMSPEQCRGEAVGPATDLYAGGILLHELLTGTVPFVDANPMAVIHGHLAKVPPPISNRWPHLAAFAPVVKRALAKDPAARYPDALAFREALEAIPLAQSRAAPVSGVHVAGAGAAQAAMTTRVQPAPVAPASNRGWAILAVLGAGVVIGSWFLREATYPPPASTSPTPVNSPVPPNPLEGRILEELEKIRGAVTTPWPSFVVSAHDRSGLFIRLPYSARVRIWTAQVSPRLAGFLPRRSGHWPVDPHRRFVLDDATWEPQSVEESLERLVHWIEIPWPESMSNRVIRVTLHSEPVWPDTCFFVDRRGDDETVLPRTGGWAADVPGPAALRRALLLQTRDQIREIWSLLKVRRTWPPEVVELLSVHASASEEIALALGEMARGRDPRSTAAFTALLRSSRPNRSGLLEQIRDAVPGDSPVHALARRSLPEVATRVEPISTSFRQLIHGHTFSYLRVQTPDLSQLWVWLARGPRAARIRALPREPDGWAQAGSPPRILESAIGEGLAGLEWERSGPSDPPPRRVHLRVLPWSAGEDVRVIKITSSPDPGGRALAAYVDERMTESFHDLRKVSAGRAEEVSVDRVRPMVMDNPSVEYLGYSDRCDPYLELRHVPAERITRATEGLIWAIKAAGLCPDRHSRLFSLHMLKRGLEEKWLPESGHGLIESLMTLDEPDLAYDVWELLHKHGWWKVGPWSTCVTIYAGFEDRILEALFAKFTTSDDKEEAYHAAQQIHASDRPEADARLLELQERFRSEGRHEWYLDVMRSLAIPVPP